MSRGRFALLLTLVAMVVAATSFVVALQVLDNGEPDPPPKAGAEDSASSAQPPDDTGSTSSSTTSTTAAPILRPGQLSTPAWVAVVASEGSRAEAEQIAERVAAAGHPAGVLRSDDYTSLSAGHWVAYAGPYPDSTAADAAVDALADGDFEGAYVRCVGTKKECDGGGKGGGDGDD